jgi:chromosome segregation ATPase
MTTRIDRARAAVAAAEEEFKQRGRDLYELDQRSGAYVSRPLPTDPAGLELRRQTLQELGDEATKRKAARFAAQQRLQSAREELAAAERELENARRAVADLRTQASSAESFRARAQAEADTWRHRRDEATALLPGAEAHLAELT